MTLTHYEITRWQSAPPVYYPVSSDTMQDLTLLSYMLDKLYNRFLEEDETLQEDIIQLHLLVRQIDFIIRHIDLLNEHHIPPTNIPAILVK